MSKGKPKSKKKAKYLKAKKSEYRTQKQNLGRSTLTAAKFRLLKRMAHASKALRNVALYTWKRIYEAEGRAATDREIDDAMKADINYMALQSNSVQAIRNTVKEEIKSYFAALKECNTNPSKFSGRPRFPGYLGSEDKRIIQIFTVSKINNGHWKLPMSRLFEKKHGAIHIKLPKNLLGQEIKYIEIKPVQNGRFFEAHYTYAAPRIESKDNDANSANNKTNALAIDLGVNRLAACVSLSGHSFIIDGRPLKSLNRYFNKEIGHTQQRNIANGISKKVTTNKQKSLWRKRELQIDGYLGWAAGAIIRECIKLDVGTIVIGKSAGWKQHIRLGKINNQNFACIPFDKLISKVGNIAAKHGINVVVNEESYTSDASFYDGDDIPVYAPGFNGTYSFSGKRVHRGRYVSSGEIQVHADINAALNIMRKSGIAVFNAGFRAKEPYNIKRNAAV